jgi:hypothetical protein
MILAYNQQVRANSNSSAIRRGFIYVRLDGKRWVRSAEKADFMPNEKIKCKKFSKANFSLRRS